MCYQSNSNCSIIPKLLHKVDWSNNFLKTRVNWWKQLLFVLPQRRRGQYYPLIHVSLCIFSKGLWKRITIFLFFSQTVYSIVMLYAGLNVQLKIGINQSLIWLHHNPMLLMTSHGYIKHTAPFCKVNWFVLLFHIYTVMCMVSKLFSNQ